MDSSEFHVVLRHTATDPAGLAAPDEDIQFASHLDADTGDVVVAIQSTRRPGATIRIPKAELDAAERDPGAARDPARLEIERQYPAARRGHVALTLAMQRFRREPPDATTGRP